MSHNRVRVAVVGLGFGAAFPPIYADHPDVEYVGICDLDIDLLNDYGDRHGFEHRHTDFDEILASDDYDAVHLVTPIHSHAKLTLAVLEAGKHCAVTVPMGTTIDEIRAIVATERRTGLTYMMMETAVYTHHCLYAQSLYDAGEFGRIQLMRGAHYQDMEGWPEYWQGLPPMHYATHAISPLLAITGTRTTSVRCLGSGVMSPELTDQYGNPYPIETAIFKIDTDYQLAMEITRSLFATARRYMESFNLYGEKCSFEWLMESELPVLSRMSDQLSSHGRVRGLTLSHERIVPPDTSGLLPPEIRKHSRHQVVPDPDNPHLSVMQGGGHHGSHPHLVHEFVHSIIESRRSRVDAVTAANWTAPGICAHESAMQGGSEVAVPEFGGGA